MSDYTERKAAERGKSFWSQVAEHVFVAVAIVIVVALAVHYKLVSEPHPSTGLMQQFLNSPSF